MKTLATWILVVAATVTQALAAGGGADEGMGMLATLFATFCALIIAFQCVPGMLMFGGMLKGLFGWVAKGEHKA